MSQNYQKTLKKYYKWLNRKNTAPAVLPTAGTVMDFSVREISAFVAAIWLGGLAFQYPIGWISDRMDRRVLIMALAVFGTLVTLGIVASDPGIWGYLLGAALLGGVANPAYSLLIAYTNDFLDASDMASASAPVWRWRLR